jgi:hypothetical protein
MQKFLIKQTYVDRDQNQIYNVMGPDEVRADNLGELFRNLQQALGRCISKMYVDGDDGEAIQVGWVFQKRTFYVDERTHKKVPFLKETWVDVYTKYEKRTVFEIETPFEPGKVINHDC